MEKPNRGSAGYRMSLKEMRPLLDHMPSGVAYVKVRYQGRKAVDLFHLYTNLAYDRHSGLSNVVGKWTSEILPDFPSTNKGELVIYGRVARGDRSEQFETFVPSLNRWFRQSLYSPKRDHVVSIFDDITATKTHEYEIQAANNRLEAALSGSNLGLWEADFADDKLYLDDRTVSMLGYPVTLTPSSMSEAFRMLHPEDVGYVKDELTKHLKGVSSILNVETRIRHHEGHWIWLRSSGKISTYDDQGQPRRMVGTTTDISVQRRLSSEGFDLVKRFESMLHGFVTGNAARQKPSTVQAAPADVDQLSRRQRQMVVLIANGLKSADIAKKLGIALATVVSHRQVVMRKLNLHSSADVTRFAIENGLI